MDNLNKQLNNRENKQLKEWVSEWQAGIFPFHRTEVHNILIKYMPLLSKQKENTKILVPLCGKSLDMKWLYDQGHTVVGIEIASEAIKQFFTEQNVEYTSETVEKFTCYKNADERIKIYCGDLYDFTSSIEDQFDAVWDKSSFNAIELTDREKYAKCLTDLLKQDGMYLMMTPNYDTSVMKGPPRCVSDEDIQQFFGDKCDIEKLEEFDALNERWKSLGHKYFNSVVHLMSFKKSQS